MPTERSAQLSDYGLLLRRQWWVVVATIGTAIALALVYSAVASPEYTSTTSLLVTPTGTPSERPSGSRSDSVINMDTEAQIITSTDVVGDVADELGYSGDPQELAARLTVTVPPNTEILDIAFRASSAAEARRGAEAFASAYLENRGAGAEGSLQSARDSLQARIDDLNARLEDVTKAIAESPEGSAQRAYNQAQISGLNDQLSDLGAQLNELDAIEVTPGRVITQASLPVAPSSPDFLVNLGAAVLVGLLAGVGLAVLKQRSDPYVRSAGDVTRQVGVQLLADMPESMDPDRVQVAAPGTPEGRSYTRLRNVLAASTNKDARIVLVAGVSGRGGPVAANLAAALARSGEATVLVCGDVHSSTDVELLGRSGEAGLVEVLAGRATLTEALQPAPALPDLRILGPGHDRDLAAELLQTSGPRTLLAELLQSSTWVVMEAPATSTGADAQTLARHADLAVLVVQKNTTTTREILDARAQLESMRASVLGAVVVPAPPKERTWELTTGRRAGLHDADADADAIADADAGTDAGADTVDVTPEAEEPPVPAALVASRTAAPDADG